MDDLHRTMHHYQSKRLKRWLDMDQPIYFSRKYTWTNNSTKAFHSYIFDTEIPCLQCHIRCVITWGYGSKCFLWFLKSCSTPRWVCIYQVFTKCVCACTKTHTTSENGVSKYLFQWVFDWHVGSRMPSPHHATSTFQDCLSISTQFSYTKCLFYAQYVVQRHIRGLKGIVV